MAGMRVGSFLPVSWGSNPRIEQGYESFVLVGWGETHGPPFASYGELVAQGHFVVADDPEYHQKDQ